MEMIPMRMKPIIESYDVDEEYLYSKPYLFIKGFAVARGYKYTLKALPLARKFHNGQHRKGTTTVQGKEVHLPYVLHVLKVCSTLIMLNLPMSDEELDLLYAAALLHDSLEDAEKYFPENGEEFMRDYGFPPRLVRIVRSLSKRSGASELELNAYFNDIKTDKMALLIKLADRSHNVEDLYNMSPEKLHKYVAETREYIYPLASYAKQNYPELSNGITVLKSKIVSLTECTETIVEMYEAKIKAYENRIKALEKQNTVSKKG